MLEIEECRKLLLNEIKPKETTMMVHITECEGMVLGKDVVAKMMVPPFPKSAMDGYAVRAEDIEGASKDNPVVLNVAGELLAGDYKEIPYEKNVAVRVMTGSYIPAGFDAVIRQEDTNYGETDVEIYASVKPYANYCKVGEDIKAGDVVIKENTRLSSVHVGLLASLGVEWVSVRQPARIAIISTGTEVTEVGKPLLPGKIYNSIAYMLLADIKREKLKVISTETCVDEEEFLLEKIKLALIRADFVITTGAVSVGKKDIIPQVLEKAGAKVLFKRANIQPGTLTMASVADGKVILSLSGNPYAAVANFELYFWSAMAKMMANSSYEAKKETAVLDCEYTKVNKMRRLIRAFCKDGKVTIPSNVHASSVIGNMTQCNCFIDLEAGREVKPGDEVVVRYFKGNNLVL